MNNRNNTHVTTALPFAHPVDAGIIRVLDNPLLRRSMESLLEDFVDHRFTAQQTEGLPLELYSKTLRETIENCVKTLGIPTPRVVITGEIGVNAFTYGTDKACYIAIGSSLNRFFSQEEMAFVIGHECGHIALGHMLYHSILNYLASFGSAVPVIGPVVANTALFPLNHWSRCSEISADRAGLICCRDLPSAKKALLHCTVGAANSADLDEEVIARYVDRACDFHEASAIGKYMEFFRTHPHSYKRIAALDLFAQSEKYYRAVNLPVPSDRRLLSDKELETKTAEILKIWET